METHLYFQGIVFFVAPSGFLRGLIETLQNLDVLFLVQWSIWAGDRVRVTERLGWWLNQPNPVEKYARQIGNLPQFSGWKWGEN